MSLMTKPKWVYLMGQKYDKIKLRKDFLKGNPIFAPVIANIEKSLENEDSEIVIFFPDCNLSDLHDLIKYLTLETPQRLEKINCSLDKILSLLKKHTEDPEEVVNKVEVPTDDWMLLVNDFLRTEFPELWTNQLIETIPVSEPVPDYYDPERLYPSPWTCPSSELDMSTSDDKGSLKERALDWLKSKIENNCIVGRLHVDSLLKAMIPDAKRHSEEILPSKVKHFIEWNGYEFHGTGKNTHYAKEDAAIDAITQLLKVKLKGFVPPSSSTFYGEIMRKIRLDEVSLKGKKRTYQMSVKLSSTGQVIKGKGSSFFSAKQRTYSSACRTLSINKNIEVENANKEALIKFYTREMEKSLDRSMQKESVTDQKSSSSDKLTKSFETVNSSVLTNSNDAKCEPVTGILQDKEKERLKYNGLTWIKSNLKKHLFDKVKPDEILHNFLPKAVLSVMKTDATTICKVKYKAFNWIGEGSKVKEAKEDVVNQVLAEVFGIDLVPVHFPNIKGLKRDLDDLVTVKEKDKGFISTLVYQDQTFELTVPSDDPETAKSLIIKSALSDISNTHKLQARMSNRKMFSTFFVDEKAALVDRVEFVLDHFTFNEIVGRSRFEATDFLLDLYERTLLDEIDKNIDMEPLEGNKFQATTLLNGQEVSCVASTRTKARARLILKAVSEMETLEKEIVVEKPQTVLVEESDSDSKYSSSSLVISIDDSDDIGQKHRVSPDIKFYQKRALDILRSNRLRRRREKGLFISPKCVIKDVLGHVKLNVVSYTKKDSFDHRVTIDFCGELVEGSGYNEHVAEQDACRLVFVNVLKIDWEREVQGYKS